MATGIDSSLSEGFKILTEVPMETVRGWWFKLGDFGGIFDLSVDSSFEEFYRQIRESSVVVEFPFGIGRLDGVNYADSGEVHGVFFGPGVFREKKSLKSAVRITASMFRLKRVFCVIPFPGRALRRLLEGIGFQFAGVEYRSFMGIQVPSTRMVLEVKNGNRQ